MKRLREHIQSDDSEELSVSESENDDNQSNEGSDQDEIIKSHRIAVAGNLEEDESDESESSSESSDSERDAWAESLKKQKTYHMSEKLAEQAIAAQAFWQDDVPLSKSADELRQALDVINSILLDGETPRTAMNRLMKRTNSRPWQRKEKPSSEDTKLFDKLTEACEIVNARVKADVFDTKKEDFLR